MRLVIPESLKDEILKNYHDDAFSGHLGAAKTNAKIQEKYWWARMYYDINQYVSTCAICAKMNK